MSDTSKILTDQDIDFLLDELGLLKKSEQLSDLVDAYLNEEYRTVLQDGHAKEIFKQCLDRLPNTENSASEPWQAGVSGEMGVARALLTGLASFNAFLQANVTGPPLSMRSLLFSDDLDALEVYSQRKKCLASLDVDGLSVYQHIPHVELFCLARAIFTQYFPQVVSGQEHDSKWMRIRVNVYHQRLLSLGASNTRLSDSAVRLQTQIEADVSALQNCMFSMGSKYSTEGKVQFLLEKAQIYIMQGIDVKARENVQMAKTFSGFNYVLSGALGKRTKFQQKDISQLVVFAKSDGPRISAENRGTDGSTLTTRNAASNGDVLSQKGPLALELNDDTLLESIEFSKANGKVENSTIPQELADLQPNEQPQLNPLDQIILLTEATLKDTLSPLDKLNSEEILPYAVRVLNDKPTNWQIYTQALLVRSRIESHRSRTQERSVLQLQVIVDQIIADTLEESSTANKNSLPEIQITQFLPRAKPSESAPVSERLKYIFQLNTPTRWEVETELAYAWSSAGSLISALEIFRRLQLWAEVSLCYHSVGQEDKARQIVRRQLYFSSTGPEMDQFAVDAKEVLTEKWEGKIRSPPPPHAPRLWCILGDLDQDPECWQRAWQISKSRYARAQRTLGEYYTREGDLEKARQAYMSATVVNRQNSETWSRLGDIDLRVSNWDGAIIAFQQSIMIDDSDAKTYSNLGSALLSKHDEMLDTQKAGTKSFNAASHADNLMDDEDIANSDFSRNTTQEPLNPKDILRQALIAYKRGASIAHSNWQIWDNVITIASRMTPVSFPDILLATRAILRIRTPAIGEQAIDIAILRAMVNEVISTDRIPSAAINSSITTTTSPTAREKIYTPPRGTLARAVLDTVDAEIIPLITTRAAIWSLVEKLRLYCMDYERALACAEKAWRVATIGEEWLTDEGRWKEVVGLTDALVGAFENYGPQEVGLGGGDGTEGGGGEGSKMVEKAWRSKAKSAVRGVMGRARGVWEGSEGWEMLEGRLDELKHA